MKVLCLLLLLALPLTSSAQKASTPVAPDLLIITYKLGTIVRIDTSRSGPFAQLEGPSGLATEINPPSSESRVKGEIKLRNNGARLIKRVECEFLLTERAGPITTVSQLTMRVKKTIRPGATVKVSQWIRGYSSLKAWSRLQKQGLIHVGFNVTRIEYADRSVWERGPLRLPFRN